MPGIRPGSWPRRSGRVSLSEPAGSMTGHRSPGRRPEPATSCATDGQPTRTTAGCISAGSPAHPSGRRQPSPRADGARRIDGSPWTGECLRVTGADEVGRPASTPSAPTTRGGARGYPTDPVARAPHHPPRDWPHGHRVIGHGAGGSRPRRGVSSDDVPGRGGWPRSGSWTPCTGSPAPRARPAGGSSRRTTWRQPISSTSGWWTCRPSAGAPTACTPRTPPSGRTSTRSWTTCRHAADAARTTAPCDQAAIETFAPWWQRSARPVCARVRGSAPRAVDTRQGGAAMRLFATCVILACLPASCSGRATSFGRLPAGSRRRHRVRDPPRPCSRTRWGRLRGARQQRGRSVGFLEGRMDP